MRGYLSALVLLAVLASSLASGAASSAPEPGTLYLRPRGETVYHNVSTFPPGPDAPVFVASEPPGATTAVWNWWVNLSPADWRLERGETVTVFVVFEGLERAIPVGDPEHSDAFGKLKVQADVEYGNDRRVLGSASTTLEPRWPLGAPERVPVELAVPIDLAGEWAGPGAEERFYFGIRITLTGSMPRDDPVGILVGSSETPSHVIVPGFPVAAFRAWEVAEAKQQACAERILQKLPCEPDATQPEAAVENETVPAPGFRPIMGLVAAATVIGALFVRRFSNR